MEKDTKRGEHVYRRQESAMEYAKKFAAKILNSPSENAARYFFQRSKNMRLLPFSSMWFSHHQDHALQGPFSIGFSLLDRKCESLQNRSVVNVVEILINPSPQIVSKVAQVHLGCPGKKARSAESIVIPAN